MVTPPSDQLCDALDILKVADSVLFLLSAAGEGLDSEGEILLSAAFAQGLPTPVIAASNVGDLPVKACKYIIPEIAPSYSILINIKCKNEHLTKACHSQSSCFEAKVLFN